MMNIYLEIGSKRIFACAADWLGWCRSGRSEEAAIQALFDSAPRYAAILHAFQLDFEPPASAEAFNVVERVSGNASTDFGAPDAIPEMDRIAMSGIDLVRMKALFLAYWSAFDTTVANALGKELRKGLRGGGRHLEGIVQHVIEADSGYLRRLTRKTTRDKKAPQQAQLAQLRQDIRDALDWAYQGNLPERGPRGGSIWPPRYFGRRSAWHTLDHLWEIEDRIVYK